MAAGDLVTASWHMELRTTLMGASTIYGLDMTRDPFAGLYDVVVELAETAYAHAAGSFVGQSRDAARTANIALILRGGATVVGAGRTTMRTVWAKSAVELPLHFQAPGQAKAYVMGFPAGITFANQLSQFGALRAQASFRITDPTIYTV